MNPRLGRKQLELLRAIGVTSALVVPTATSRRLCDLGLMRSDHEDGAFAHITANGLRALADAVDAGKITLFDAGEWKRQMKGDEK